MGKEGVALVGIMIIATSVLIVAYGFTNSGSSLDKSLVINPDINITYTNSSETDPVAVPMFADYYNQSEINVLLTDIQDGNITNDLTIESTKNITTTKYIKPTQGALFTNGTTTWRVIVNGTGCFRVEQVV
jgi:hypothetical protein